VFGEQAFPVRSELAVEDAKNVILLFRHVDIEPFSRDGGTNVGLVLMVGIDDVDLDVFSAAGKVFRRHARGFHRTHAVGVLKDSGNVVEHADAHHIAGDLGVRNAGGGA
jgi:hypothetical protein